MHRARQHVTEGRPRFTPAREEHQRLLGQFVQALSRHVAPAMNMLYADRDGNSPAGVSAASYRLLAEALAAKGISSARADKRGIAGSRAATTNPNQVTIDDYAADALAWTKALLQEPYFDGPSAALVERGALRPWPGVGRGLVEEIKSEEPVRLRSRARACRSWRRSCACGRPPRTRAWSIPRRRRRAPSWRRWASSWTSSCRTSTRS